MSDPKTDQVFYRWWVSRKGRPPLPEETEEFELARELWEEMVGHRLAPAEQPDEKTYADGYRECSEQILAKWPRLFAVVWSGWAQQLMPDWWPPEPGSMDTEDGNRKVRPHFRALRSDDERTFEVALMRPGSTIARLEDVDHVVCRISTVRGSDSTMRADYQAAEAFATMLTDLPNLIYVQHHIEAFLGRRPPLTPMASLPPETTDDGESTPP